MRAIAIILRALVETGVLAAVSLAAGYVVILPLAALSLMVGEAGDSSWATLGFLISFIILAGLQYGIDVMGVQPLVSDEESVLPDYFSCIRILRRLAEFFVAWQVATLVIALVLSVPLFVSWIDPQGFVIALSLAPIALLVIQQAYFAHPAPQSPWRRYIPTLEEYRREINAAAAPEVMRSGRRALLWVLGLGAYCAVIFAASLIAEACCEIELSRLPALWETALLSGLIACVVLLGWGLEIARFLRSSTWFGLAAGVLMIGMGAGILVWAFNLEPKTDFSECAIEEPARGALDAYWRNACAQQISQESENIFVLRVLAFVCGLGLAIAGTVMVLGSVKRPRLENRNPGTG